MIEVLDVFVDVVIDASFRLLGSRNDMGAGDSCLRVIVLKRGHAVDTCSLTARRSARIPVDPFGKTYMYIFYERVHLRTKLREYKKYYELHSWTAFRNSNDFNIQSHLFAIILPLIYTRNFYSPGCLACKASGCPRTPGYRRSRLHTRPMHHRNRMGCGRSHHTLRRHSLHAHRRSRMGYCMCKTKNC